MKRTDEVIVGIFVTVAVLVGITGTLYLARRGWTKTYPMYARFDWGQNLKVGQPVYLAGVQVGFVQKVDLDPGGYLDVTMSVDRDRRIPEGSTVSVQSEGIFGDKSVAIKPCRRPEPMAGAPSETSRGAPPPVRAADATPTCRPGAFLPPSDTIPTGRAAPTMDEILVRVDSMSAALGDVTRTVRLEFVQNGGIASLRKTIASTDTLVQTLTGVARTQSKALSATLASLRRTLDAIDSAAVDSTMHNMATTSRNLNALSRDLDSASLRMNRILAKIDEGKGTAGLLINDPGVYDNLRSLLARLDSLTADIKANPKKYINVKVF
ncbi:MAG TPA: MlaD family protein [Gemmatimonadaceae bacterium]|nr:MlaD family protein [Gemmatimonadaceae bacterium]